ncbi:MAG: hypothetical protein ACREQA_19785 [Candidatus Binatia bacterium]
MAYGDLLSILGEAARNRRDALSKPPVACPNDGEPLRKGPGGVLYCSFDGWQYPRDGITAIR